MVTGENREPRRLRAAVEFSEQVADLSIHQRHFPVVRTPFSFLAQVGRRLVGIVRIVVVDPQKPGLGRAPDPIESGTGGLIRPSLGESLGAELVVVVGKTTVQAMVGCQRKPTHERCRPVPQNREALGESGDLSQHLTVGPGSVMPWQEAGHHGSVGGKGHRSRRHRGRKTKTSRRQGVEIRSVLSLGDPSQRIGTQSVDGENQDIGMGFLTKRHRRGTWPPGQHRAGQQARENESRPQGPRFLAEHSSHGFSCPGFYRASNHQKRRPRRTAFSIDRVRTD